MLKPIVMMLLPLHMTLLYSLAMLITSAYSSLVDVILAQNALLLLLTATTPFLFLPSSSYILYLLHTRPVKPSYLRIFPQYCIAMKVFISYVYYKSPSSDYNLRYFIENEIKYRTNVFYSIVVNGKVVSYDIPELSNVRVIYRDNVGYDFGGHRASLNAIDKDMFDYFFFMNSGVIGPVLKDRNKEWYSHFTNKITKKVKLVGTTIVCLSLIHI